MEGKKDISSEDPCPNSNSVDLAYEFVKSSYDVMASRFEAANARISNLMAWAIGAIGIIPIFAKSLLGSVGVTSLWLLAALATFVVLTAVGIIAYRTGGIKLLHPKSLYNDYIQLPEREFKRWLVYWSGEHFNTNLNHINAKSRCIDGMTILLGLEVIFLVLWAIKG